MPFKNIFYPEENALLTIFYGTISPLDMRDYAISMVSQTVLTEGFSRITDGTMIKEIGVFPEGNLNTVVQYKARDGVIRSNGGIIVSNSLQLDEFAQKIISEGKKRGDSIEIRTTLSDALTHYGLAHLHSKMSTELNIIREYFHNPRN